nr:hypothetical protein [Tanacetum cinerariifolium]
DAWLITVTWAEFKKLFFLQFFPRAEQEPGFLEAAAGTEEEQAKNFQWGLRRSTLNHLMCMSYTDVAQVANAARNYEILHERDDDDAERPDKRRLVIDISRPLNRVVTGTTVIITTVMDQTGEKSGDRHQPTTQQSSHRNHGHNNDRHGSDRRGGGGNHHSNNNYSGNNNRNSGNGRDQRNRGQQSNRSTNFGVPKDCKKNTTAGTSGQVDKKPCASGRVFAITKGHTANTSSTITGTLFIYGHAVFVLFDTGATHSVISSAFASRVTTTPTLLDHVLCISTHMQDSVRITYVYRNLPLQFDDKIRPINALPLDMCEFDIIL